ncbi:MAG: nuclear transport factor 2 family protein, partial [Bacteroidota bacterium]
MKNYLSILIAILLLAGIAFPQKAEANKKETAEKEVNVILDNLHAFLKAKNIDAYSALLSDNGLYCGTDSKEFWDKTSLINLQK